MSVLVPALVYMVIDFLVLVFEDQVRLFVRENGVFVNVPDIHTVKNCRDFESNAPTN